MKKTLATIVASIFMLLTVSTAHATVSIVQQPSETVILNLPNNEAVNWKEVAWSVTATQGLVERIPKTQNNQDWSELITVQFFHKSLLPERRAANIMTRALDRIRESALCSHPESMVTWNIIEKNKNDSIYEEILHTPHKDSLPYHKVTRCFLTDTGFHSISFTHKATKMSADERTTWIRLLKESASVVPLKEAAHTVSGLSMADKLQNSLDLGAFISWKIVSKDIYDDATTIVCLIPSDQIDVTATETLGVLTRPNLNSVSINQAFNAEMEVLKQQCLTSSPHLNIIPILKETTTEFIYSNSEPIDNRYHNRVTRTVISDTNHYSFFYTRMLDRKMTKDEVLQCQKKLEMIKISH